MRQLDSISQAFMLVRSNMAAHGELLGMFGGSAFYAYSVGDVRTVICRPAGARPEGVVPHGAQHDGRGELVGTRTSSRKGH